MKQLALLAAVLIALSAILLLTVNGRPQGVLEDQLEKIKETGNDDVPLEVYSINSPYSGVFEGDGFAEKHFELQNKTNNSKPHCTLSCLHSSVYHTKLQRQIQKILFRGLSARSARKSHPFDCL